jgi:carboxypeptidase PM20D1
VKRPIAALAAALAILAAVLMVRAWRMPSRQIAVAPAPPVAVDGDAVAQRLAGALRIPTVSNQDPARFEGAPFRALHAYLAERFPRVHRELRRDVVNDYSLLYTWEGSGAGQPAVLLAHLDVVPADPSTEAEWTQPPFGGVIADGFIWGRGAIDDKGSLLAMLEAVEHHLAAGYQPPRTVLLAFGHDEEVSGERGARAIAELLRGRGVSPAFVLDEGGAILEGLFPGVDVPVATIGTAEKGYATIELTVEGTGGHSSMPPPRTAVGQLSAAVDRLERHPVPSNINAALVQSLTYVGPEMAFPLRLLFANLWLFRPLLESQMAGAPQTNALIRTTTAPTMIYGGVKENQLPTSARAAVNFRILPGDSVDGVVEHVRRTIDDPQVKVAVLGHSNEPSPVSAVDSPMFTYLARTVRATNPETLVSPFLVLGGTDARHYSGLTSNVYRFVPLRMRPDDLVRFHGIDERIAVADYVGMIQFYVQLLGGLQGLSEIGAADVPSSAE